MGGPNLEVFKFGIYVFFPVLVFWHYGDPDWYARNVGPYKDKLFPPDKQTVRNLPTERGTIQERIQSELTARRAARDRAAAAERTEGVEETQAAVQSEEPPRRLV